MKYLWKSGDWPVDSAHFSASAKFMPGESGLLPMLEGVLGKMFEGIVIRFSHKLE